MDKKLWNEIFRENSITEKIDKKILSKLDKNAFDNILRHIPTGSKVRTIKGNKGLKFFVTVSRGGGMTTKDIKNVERQILHDIDLFITDAKKFINIITSNIHPYIFMRGGDNKNIEFTQEFSIEVKTKPEDIKLDQLDNEIKTSRRPFKYLK